MAPRFVELSRPVEDGVAWASSIPATVGNRVRSLLDKSDIQGWAAWCRMNVPEINFAPGFLGLLPQARLETKYLFVSALAAVILRCFFVFLKSRSILSIYGATKMMHKEM
mgnify:CR=1 FL=1